jgi:hypothetical protein
VSLIDEVIKAFRDQEERTGRPVTSVELTRPQYAALKQAMYENGAVFQNDNQYKPDSIMGVKIRIKK